MQDISNEQNEEDYQFQITDTLQQSKQHTLQYRNNQILVLNLLNSTFYVDKKYHLLKVIGNCLDSIHIQFQIRKTKQKVLMKYFKKLPKESYYIRQILQDLKMQLFFDHENIQKVIDISFPLQSQNICEMYYTTDYMDTNLKYIIQSLQPLTDDHIISIMIQILSALNYIHSSKIIYCKLNPQNILINQNCELKLSNFSESRSYENDREDLDIDLFQKYYLAPEILLAKSYSYKSDIWAAGCVFVELFKRRKLFDGENNIDNIKKQIQFCGKPSQEDMKFITNQNVINFIQNLPFFDKISLIQEISNANPIALDLIDQMLQFNPEKRFTSLQCLQHEYFQDFFDMKDQAICVKEFDWSYQDNQIKYTEQDFYKILYKESLYFNYK